MYLLCVGVSVLAVADPVIKFGAALECGIVPPLGSGLKAPGQGDEVSPKLPIFLYLIN